MHIYGQICREEELAELLHSTANSVLDGFDIAAGYPAYSPEMSVGRLNSSDSGEVQVVFICGLPASDHSVGGRVD